MRTYVKVSTVFDTMGFMQPSTITWKDGRVFRIDAVTDFRPADSVEKGLSGDCYTVIIGGEQRHLFFEKSQSGFSGRMGRWFVESGV